MKTSVIILVFVLVQVGAEWAHGVQVQRQCHRPSFAKSEFAQRLRLEAIRRDGFAAFENSIAKQKARIQQGIPALKAQSKKQAAAHERARQEYIQLRDRLREQRKKQHQIAFEQYQHEEQLRKFDQECARQNYIIEHRRFDQILRQSGKDGSGVYRDY